MKPRIDGPTILRGTLRAFPIEGPLPDRAPGPPKVDGAGDRAPQGWRGLEVFAKRFAEQLLEIGSLPLPSFAAAISESNDFFDHYVELRKAGTDLSAVVGRAPRVEFGARIAPQPGRVDQFWRIPETFMLVPREGPIAPGEKMYSFSRDFDGAWQLRSRADVESNETPHYLSSLSIDSLASVEAALKERLADPNAPLKEAAMARELILELGTARERRMTKLSEDMDFNAKKLAAFIGTTGAFWADEETFAALIERAWPEAKEAK
jgi:hypothetical protein